jgi:hypothetical protein
VYCADKVYNYLAATYTKPYEHFFFRTVGNKDFGLPGFPMVAKGLDSLSRGKLIHSVYLELMRKPTGSYHIISDGDDCLLLFRTIDGVLVVCVDITGFDVHTRVPLLEIFRDFVGSFFYDRSLWVSLLTEALRSRGWAAGHTVKFQVDGNLCSGDMFTSICGVSIMLIILTFSVRWLGTGYLWCEGAQALFLKLGYKLKLEKIVPISSELDLVKIEFTQSHPIRTPYGWRMVPLPEKAVSSCSCVTGWGPSVTDRGARLRAIAFSEMAMSQGVPVLQAHAEWLLEHSKAYGRGQLDPTADYKFRRERRNHLPMFPVPVPWESRLDFSVAYPQWTVSRQLLFEASLRCFKPQLTTVQTFRLPGLGRPDHNVVPMYRAVEVRAD